MVLTGYSTTSPLPRTVPSYISIPTIELVRSYLCSYPAGALIDVTVRCLADVIGRGKRAWGAISPALKRLERDGYIACLPTSSGTLVEVLKSDQTLDRPQTASQSDQHADRSKAPAAASAETIMAPQSDEMVPVSDQATDRMFGASQRDQDVDRTDVYGTSPGWNQQQQQHARACEGKEGEQEPLATPAGISAGEWTHIRAAAPAYTESDLLRDLGKLATRGGISNPVGLIIAALRAEEPIYSRQELQERAAALAPPPPEPALVCPTAPRQEQRRGRRGDVERHIEAPPVSEDDLEQAAALEARVSELAPPDADDLDIGVLIVALTAGATDSDALAQMEAERVVRAALPSSDEVFDALQRHARQRHE